MKQYAWLSVWIAFGVAAPSAAARDWPTYRGDPQRSGSTGESLPGELTLHWQHRARHAPRPAWSGRDTRMPFDRAFHPVISGGRLFFGSSADCKVYAFDAADGRRLWSFFCDGPVRFAPAVEGDRLFVTSDDGHLYCLAANDGRLLWKLRGGPADSKILGNDRLISRWPARGGPAVQDGVVYFAAGIWPSEGIFVYAVDTASGRVLWCNDRSGGIEMPQPHPGANAASGVSAQGYLVLAGDMLLVPTGRAVPAAFDRKTGELLYFHLQQNGRVGGSEVVAGSDWHLNGQTVFETATGARRVAAPGLACPLTAAFADEIVHWAAGEVRSSRWKEQSAADRKGSPRNAAVLEPVKTTTCPFGGNALVVAGGKAVSAGPGAEGYGVAAVDLSTGRWSWSSSMESEPLGLAVAGGRLYVTTAEGTIACYGGPRPGPAVERETVLPKSDAPAYEDFESYERCAKEILERTGADEGYCVDLACGDGALAYAMAKHSDLQVYAFDSDPAKVGEARRKLDAAGLYGTRVTVQVGDSDASTLPDYFADLVLSGRAARDGTPLSPQDPAWRIVRPYGGAACAGKPGAMTVSVRGPLEGAGSWTHQYCDPANSNCSDDTLVRGPLGVLWFSDLAFPAPSRHGRGRAPLFLDGRLFIQGLDALLCASAYNGRKLWECPLPGIQKAFDGEHLMGTSGTGSNYCVGPTGLYTHTGGECLRIDPATGELLSRFPAPSQPDGKPGTWGIVALEGDALFGTLADARHLVTFRYREGDMSRQFTESISLFAMDAVTGELRWRYNPEHTIRHNAVAVGNGRVYLIDRPAAVGDREREKRIGVPDPGDEHPPGRLVALDSADGRRLWDSDDEIYGTTLALSTEHDVLLMCYQNWRFKLASELGGRMAAFDAATGKRRWDIEASYQTRPVINGRTVYLQPGAWDLLTGEKTGFAFERSYGCGIPSGCVNMLVYRSATVGYVDLLHDCGTENYGGVRPGCWINAVPAGGLVLMPDATDRCTCSYLNKASIALAPLGLRPPGIAPDGTCRREALEVEPECDEAFAGGTSPSTPGAAPGPGSEACAGRPSG